jgi:hypothetical protein
MNSQHEQKIDLQIPDKFKIERVQPPPKCRWCTKETCKCRPRCEICGQFISKYTGICKNVSYDYEYGYEHD